MILPKAFAPTQSVRSKGDINFFLNLAPDALRRSGAEAEQKKEKVL